MVNTVEKTGLVIEVEYYDGKFSEIFFDVTDCQQEGPYLAIAHHAPNRNNEGETIHLITNIDLKRVKGWKTFMSLEDFNGYHGIYPKPTWQNDGDIVPEWGVGKKYKIEVEYLDKDNKPDRIVVMNVTNASYIQEAGLDMLQFEYILKDGHASHWGIGLSKLVKWKVIEEME